ncbi:sulfite exporter TauE/SafE family protein [Arenimonas fontis]|nr:sulfite exporter TauE/SafE family protein [Arenimonas fontis]
MASPDHAAWLLAGLFFLIATLYSSVGHAGASGYLAAMALLGLAPEQMRPTALALNLLVGGIGLLRFHRAGLVPWRRLPPFVLASAPATYLAARTPVPQETYALVVGALLLVAALLLLRSALRQHGTGDERPPRQVRWTYALPVGAAIGTLSGLTGTGGAIFLTPLLLFARWAPIREAAGLSVAFVWVNSVLGMAGVWQATGALPTALPLWLAAVALGGMLGSWLGVHRLPPRGLRIALSLVLMIASGKLLLA